MCYQAYLNVFGKDATLAEIFKEFENNSVQVRK